MSRAISLWQRWLLMPGPSSSPLYSACSCLRKRGFAESTYANSHASVVPANSKLWLTIFTDAVVPKGMSVARGYTRQVGYRNRPGVGCTGELHQTYAVAGAATSAAATAIAEKLCAAARVQFMRGLLT
jgi:hypothetical protein